MPKHIRSMGVIKLTHTFLWQRSIINSFFKLFCDYFSKATAIAFDMSLHTSKHFWFKGGLGKRRQPN